MNNKSVIFASYIPNKNNLWVGIEILDKLCESYSDYDIYIGINPSCDEWIDVIKEYKSKLNIYYEITSKELVINSDASAFQTALNLYKKINKKYEIVWFIHTKGVTSNKHIFRQKFMYGIFLDKKLEIENIFNDKEIGLFSPYMYKIKGTQWDNYIENNLKSILNGSNYKSTNLSCYYTFYVLRGNIINNFVKDVDKSFFEENLLNLGVEQKFDRYFFERDFPMISEKYGYKSFPEPIKDGENDFEWVKKNQ